MKIFAIISCIISLIAISAIARFLNDIVLEKTKIKAEDIVASLIIVTPFVLSVVTAAFLLIEVS